MPSPRRPIATRALAGVAVAALALAFTGAPETVGASVPLSRAGAAALTRSALASFPARRTLLLPSSATPARSARLLPPDPAGPADWAWPVPGARTVTRGFEAPPTRYSAGHRGIDIAAQTDAEVVAPESGVVRFSGVVVNRATVTLVTADGTLLSIEPVTSEWVKGDSVARGERLGTVARGGHCDSVCIHLGVRVHGEYVSPMRFFGGIPRAVLLPLR
jgi:murein DD-endopeptidase MepM/ murein hydrolase activator NlpD